MSRTVNIPTLTREIVEYTPPDSKPYEVDRTALTTRKAYAAAHVVTDPLATTSEQPADHIDWDATMEFRHHIWSSGLGVAEAMDTAQRGMGLSWAGAQELITRSLREARSVGGSIVCGVQTDQLAMSKKWTLAEIAEAYMEQCAHVENDGGQVVLMASPHLAATARSAEDYLEVYDRVLGQLSRPAVIHWLGAPFDERMAGYWGSSDVNVATETVLTLLSDHAARIEGIKLSLLDQRREIELRASLPDGVRMFTGDDFDYPTTIEGDGTHYSDALLGAFDGFAPAAAAALRALDRGDLDEYHKIIDPTLPLSRHVFQTPTKYYKTGLVFLAYLNGLQNHFRMLDGLESARSTYHLAQVFVLAADGGLLHDVERAVERVRKVLSVFGIDQVAS